MSSFTRDEILRSVRRFSDYVDDLLQADHRAFPNLFKNLIAHCERDPVMSVITRPLRDSEHPDTDVEAWFARFQASRGGMVGSGRYDRPDDEEIRLSLWYKFFIRLNDGSIDFDDFAVDAFGSGDIDEEIDSFNSHFFRGWARDVGYRLEGLLQRVPQDKPVEGASLRVFSAENLHVTHIVGNHNVVATHRGAVTISSTAPDPHRLLEEVARVLRSTGHTAVAERVAVLSPDSEPADLVPVLTAAAKADSGVRARLQSFVDAAAANAAGSLFFESLRLVLYGLSSVM